MSESTKAQEKLKNIVTDADMVFEDIHADIERINWQRDRSEESQEQARQMGRYR